MAPPRAAAALALLAAGASALLGPPVEVELDLAWAPAVDCSGRASRGEDRRPDPARLRVATWNVEWLTDGRPPESPRSPWAGDPAGAAGHARRVAAALRAVPADVWVLQEVEGCAALEALRGAVGDATYRAFLVPGTDAILRQNVALLTRVDPTLAGRTAARAGYPADGSACGYAGPGSTSGVSKHLLAALAPRGLPRIALLALHLKAFPDEPRSCAQREAQALVAQGAVRAAAARGWEVLVAGDLNDFAPDPPDAAGNAPASRTVAAIADWDRDGRADLTGALEGVSRGDRWTSAWDRDGDGAAAYPGETGALDHVLLSAGLAGRLAGVRVDHLASAGASDHRPVVVELGAVGAGA